MRPPGEQRQRRRTRTYEQPRTHAETPGLTPLSDPRMAFARVAVDESEELRPWTEIEQQSNLDRESESYQPVCERPPIYGLEEPESEPIVNAIEAPKDLARELLLQEGSVRVCPRGLHPRESALTLLIEHSQKHAATTGRAH